ncbi:MAG: anthranilate phosphoribosyltransferase [Mariprofundus sp.]|nr:anthranilate phosphoribosyltransferase [Mariprofundus sp.]
MIKRVARGKNGSENLGRKEAQELFAALLLPDADALQLGAFLIAQRMKGETSAELAGFVEAARDRIPGYSQFTAPAGAVDLPCYAGKCRAAHAYLAAAIRARDAGIPVFIHGIENIDGRVSVWQVLENYGLKRASTLSEAARILASEYIVYVDLADVCPDLFRIYTLRPRLGVRSFANSVARLLNPVQCDGQLNGFFHTPYANYMAAANSLLEQPRSLIFMGAEGEPELYADRQKVIVKQQGESLQRVSYPQAGLDTYPRQPMDLILLKQQATAMLEEKINDRETAVVERMGEAFRWASKARFPVTWNMEDQS